MEKEEIEEKIFFHQKSIEDIIDAHLEEMKQAVERQEEMKQAADVHLGEIKKIIDNRLKE